jgi:alpha-L-fucosidase 2
MWGAILLAAFAAAVADAPASEPGTPRTAGNGLHFTEPVRTWDEALPLGNGTLGALVWGDGSPLKISLDHTGLWDLRPVPEFHEPDYTWQTMQAWEKEGRYDDLKRLYEDPYNRPGPTKIPAGRIELDIASPGFESTSLDIGAAQAGMALGAGAAASVWVHATEPVGLISLKGVESVQPHLRAPKFGGREKTDNTPAISAGELANLGYPGPLETSGENWQAYEQQGFDKFRFAVYLAWAMQPDGEWRAAWSVATINDGANPIEIAKERVDKALGGGYIDLEKSHRAWWDQYWRKGWLEISDPVVERQWYLDMYKFGAAARAGAPPITLQGPWTADDGKLPPWKGDYHHDLNTELSYWPAYTGARLADGQNFVDWLWETKANCEGWTRRFYNLPGLNVPMTADLLNNQIGGWRQYTHSATTSSWLAHHFYLQWRYTMDRKFLEERAYPYLSAVATFIDAVTSTRDANGKRTLPLSSSPEINDNRPEAWFPKLTNYDNALMQSALYRTAELARELGKEDEAVQWTRIIDELPDLALGKGGVLAVTEGQPLAESHRHLSHLMAIYPLGLINVTDHPDAEGIVRANMAQLKQLGTANWCGYSFAWHAALAARARDGKTAAESLRIFSEAFCLRNSFHCNGDQSGKGYSNMTYRPFTLEGNFAAAGATMEMLLQSHTGVVDVFPAMPEDWKHAAFYFLRAQGAFVVSAEWNDGAATMVEVIALTTGPCRLRIPGRKEDHVQDMKRGDVLIYKNGEFEFRAKPAV